jgi:serine/threonine protein kinase
MQIGKYTLGREIGRGGMGTVYESFHPQLSRAVAIKLIQSSDAESRRIFMYEAQTVAGLSHPHIINIFDVDEHQGQPFLVMELFQTSLADRIAKQPLVPAELIPIALQLTDALDYAHGQAIIHRDIKPANVLLRQDETPVLADFGLARAMANATTHTAGLLVGTPAYMAPEQFRHEPATVRSDLYALGVLLFEALIGQVPFDGDTTAIIKGHLQQPVPSMHTLAAYIPPALDALILSLLAKDPLQRPDSARAVAKELTTIQLQLPASPQSANSPQRAPATGPTIALRHTPNAAQLPSKHAQPAQPNLPNPPAVPKIATTQRHKSQLVGLIVIGAVILLTVLLALVVPSKSNEGASALRFPTSAFPLQTASWRQLN